MPVYFFSEYTNIPSWQEKARGNQTKFNKRELIVMLERWKQYSADIELELTGKINAAPEHLI